MCFARGGEPGDCHKYHTLLLHSGYSGTAEDEGGGDKRERERERERERKLINRAKNKLNINSINEADMNLSAYIQCKLNQSVLHLSDGVGEGDSTRALSH